MNSVQQTKARILLPLFLALIITIAYIPTFSGEFILDDRPLVKDNLFIREFASPVAYLSHEDGVGSEDISSRHTGYYRPLINFLYTVDYKIWGMKPLGFRFTNLILHLVTCITLSQFLITLGAKRFSAFAVAVLFGLHPANTESVAWVSSRNNILVTLFSLISFICYVKGVAQEKRWARPVSYAAFLAALLSKEFAIMVLPILFLYNRLISKNGKAIREEIVSYSPYIVMLLFYFMMRANAVESLVTPVPSADVWRSLYFAPFLILYNMKLIILPHGLHSYIIHYPENLISWQAFAGFTLLVLLAVVLWKERDNKILVFSLLSFLAALLPILNIVHTSAVTRVSMRWLYFPMTFLLISLAFWFQRLLKVNRLLVLSGFGAVVIYFGTYSYLLNRHLWHDEDTFFRQEVLHYKNDFYLGGLAESLYKSGDLRGAERYFLKAMERFPDMVDNYLNYAALLIEEGRLDDAAAYLDTAKSFPMSACEQGKWLNNAGMVLFKRGDYHKALHHFTRAVSWCPGVEKFWANLGGSYGSTGDYRTSVSVLTKGLSLFPDSVVLRKNLGVSYYRMGEYIGAVSVLEEIPYEIREKDPHINDLMQKARVMRKGGS